MNKKKPKIEKSYKLKKDINWAAAASPCNFAEITPCSKSDQSHSGNDLCKLSGSPD